MRQIPLVAATTGFGYLAMKFVLEPETWPVFVAWTATQGDPGAIAVDDPKMLEPLIEQMRAAMILASKEPL